MKQHTETELVDFMSSPERSIYEDKQQLIKELEADILNDTAGLQQAEERLVTLHKIAPTEEERAFDRTGSVQEQDKRLVKATNYVETYKAMLQTHTEQLRAAQEAIQIYLTRANERLGEQLRQQSERKLLAQAFVEAMQEAGFAVPVKP